MDNWIEEERERLDQEYEERVKACKAREWECVIVIKGRSAYELLSCGEDDIRYFLDEGKLLAQAKDVKSIRFYDKTSEKQKQALAAQKKVVGKGAFDGMI